MRAEDVHISLEQGRDLHHPDAETVLAGLMAYNAAALPVSGRFSVLAARLEDSAPIAGMSIAQYGGDAFCFWAGWAVPETDGPAAIALVLARLEAELARRRLARSWIYVRAHDDTGPYLAAGYQAVQTVTNHIQGGSFTLMRKEVGTDIAGPAAQPGIALSVLEPPSRPLAREIWRITDTRRQRLLGAPVQHVAAYVRDRNGGPPLGAALCYAVGDDFMVDMVWLDERLRGTGVGFDMLATALEAGRAMGCTRSGVETMDCQAPTFYPKHGYQRFGYVPSVVPGMGMNFFEMRL